MRVEELLEPERFKAEGIDKDMENKEERWRELIADLRYLGNSAFPRLKEGKKWGDWDLPLVRKYFAKIVDTLRSIYFPIIPPWPPFSDLYEKTTGKSAGRAQRASFWLLYREAEKYMERKPPKSIEEVKEWEKKRKEIIKLGRFPPLDKIDPPYVQKLTDKELVTLYRYLHHLYRVRGKVWEDLHNAHVFVGIEMVKRGIYNQNKIEDALTEATKLEILEYPTPKGIQHTLSDVPRELVEKGYVTVEDVLKYFPKEIEIRVPPSSLYLTGRLVNEGKIPVEYLSPDSKHDIDVIHRGQYDRRIPEALAMLLPPWLARKIHYHPDPDGPLEGWGIPLYNLSFKRLPLSKTRRISPWEVYDLSLVVGKPFVPVKPKSGFGKTEFWDPEEMWEKWGKERIERGIVVQRKYDGRRFTFHFDRKRGILKLFTEDRQRDRSDELKAAVQEFMKEFKGDSIILDLEIEAYRLPPNVKVKSAEGKVKLGTLIPREDTAAYTVGKVSEDLLDKAVFEVYDILYLDGRDLTKEGYLERIKTIHKVLPKNMYWWRATPFGLARSKKEFLSLVEKFRSIPGSEGVVCKTADAVYPVKYSGENRTDQFCKLKNLKEIDVMVYKVVRKKTREGKPLNQYMYECAYLIPGDRRDEFWNSFEYKGRSVSYTHLTLPTKA